MNLEDHLKYNSADCGCPEESFVYKMASVIMHLDHDGSGTAHIDFGEWSFEIDDNFNNITDLRSRVITTIDNLPVGQS